MHRWDVSPKEALRIQNTLRKRILLHRAFERIGTVAGADVSFSEQEVIAAIVVFDYETLDIVEESAARALCSFPYIPGLLTFREGPVLIKALQGLTDQPDVILFDGQGIAHPRGIGIASHVGVLLNRPTIGCAKSRLIGEYTEPDQSRGAFSPLTFQGDTIGAVIRTRQSVKPVFVSPGHMIDLDTSIGVVLNCCTRFRLPEPTRQAHHRARILKEKSRYHV